MRKPYTSRRALSETIFATAIRAALFLCAAILLFLIGTILWKGGQAVNLSFLFSPASDFGKSGGILYQLLGSLLIALTAALLVLPAAVGTAIFRHSYQRAGKAQEALDVSLYALNAIPSVTYGIFGLIFFVNILGTGISWLVGSIILAIMMLPTVTLACVQSLQAIPPNYFENAFALGMTRGEVVRRVALPQSAHGIVTGLLIALARAIGETAPIMFIATAFSGVTLPQSPFEPVSTLPTHILALAQQSTDPRALENAWGASLTLVMLAALFSLLAYGARLYLNKMRYK
jgi:phosphate transport system permease protein